MSDVGTVWSSIPLVAQAEGIAELEVYASPIRIAPHGRGFLRHGRSEARMLATKIEVRIMTA
jgi:hypothetical protein